MLARETIIEHLRDRLALHDHIRAATLGGSDATGRADSFSDVDLVLFVRPGAVEAAVASVDAAVEELTPIHSRLRLPMPTWHGFDQAFYRLENAHEWTILDWLIIPTDAPRWDSFLEVERHGTPRVLFDKDSIVRAAHIDRVALHATLHRRVAELRARWAIFSHLGPKQSARGWPVDAAHFYQTLVLRPLVDMLRILHAPERHDFGFRYLRDDLPAETYREICTLMYPSSAAVIPALTVRAGQLFERALEEWDARATQSLPVLASPTNP